MQLPLQVLLLMSSLTMKLMPLPEGKGSVSVAARREADSDDDVSAAVGCRPDHNQNALGKRIRQAFLPGVCDPAHQRATARYVSRANQLCSVRDSDLR